MTTAYEASHDEAEGPYWSGGRIGLTVIVILIVAMWLWIYLFAPRNNPDRLTTRAFASAAEVICTPLKAELDALPPGHRAVTPQDRARQVEDGTEITIEMVTALKRAAEQVTDPDDARLLGAWFEDWDAYVVDRETYVVKLDAADESTSDRDLAFTLRERASGGLYTTRISGFANVNDMASCEVPGDV